MAFDIGKKIKQLRLQLKLTQGELADRCELTKGYISQLENDLTSPSIETLKDLLLALGTNLRDFFADEEEEKIVFKTEDYFEKDNGDHKTVWLVPNSQKNEMEPILFELGAGKTSIFDMPHEGEEFGYVLSGKLRLHYGAKVRALSKGDSFYFASDKIHYVENNGDKPCKLLWISSPPNF